MAIIFSTLRKMYDCSSGQHLWGYPIIKFVKCVLIPETALLLVMEDLGLEFGSLTDHDIGLAVKEDSASYGRKCYPLDDE